MEDEGVVEAGAGLRAVIEDETIAEGTPIEATKAMELALETTDEAIARLKTPTALQERRTHPPGSPTRPQGKFPAFIRRVPHQARAIEPTVNPDWIPPLDRSLRLR